MRAIAIQKPFNINLTNKTIAAGELNSISWQSSGGQQWEREIEIRLNSDNSIAYILPREQSTSTNFTLPIDSLLNGNVYKILVTVWDINEVSGTSDPVLFSVYSRPQVEITGVPAILTTNSVNISFNYSVEEPASNQIRSWALFLYDETESLIYSSGVQYTTSLSHILTDLQNNKTYSLQIQTTSAKNMIGLSQRENFKVQYTEQPYDTSIQASNIPNAGVEISWNVLQITGEGENYSFIDNSKVNVLNGKVWFDKGYRVEGDFSIRLTLEQAPNEQFVQNPDIKIYKYNQTNDLGMEITLEDLLVVDPQLSLVAPTGLAIVASYNKPPKITYPWDSFLWIQDPLLIGQSPQQITTARDGVAPPVTLGHSSTIMWFAESYNEEGATVAEFEEVGRKITLKRFNNRFVLQSNDSLTSQQFTATGDRFCIVIKRIGSNWLMEGGGYEI